MWSDAEEALRDDRSVVSVVCVSAGGTHLQQVSPPLSPLEMNIL